MRCIFITINLMIIWTTVFSQKHYQYKVIQEEIESDIKPQPTIYYLPDAVPVKDRTSSEKTTEGELVTTFYKNGKLKDKSFYQNGKRSGLRKSFDEKGMLQQEISYVNGKIDGVKKLYSGGLLNIETTYKNDKRDGERIFYFQDGSVRFKIPYRNDKINGCTEEYSRDDGYRLVKKANFVNGRLDGLVSIFRELREYDSASGSIRKSNYLSETESYKGGVNTGLQQGYYPNGKVKRKTLVSNDQTLYDEWISSSGKLIYINKFINGKKQGLHKYFDDDEKLYLQIEYVNGLQQGKTTSFFNNGKVESERNYIADKLVGKNVSYNLDGLLKSETYYSEVGEKILIEKEYDLKGKLKAETDYSSDEVGKSVTTYIDGLKRSLVVYGKQVGLDKSVYYSSTGEILVTNLYVNGHPQGVHKFYHNDILVSTSFKDMEGNGYTSGLRPDGSVGSTSYYLKRQQVRQVDFEKIFEIKEGLLVKKESEK